MTAATPTVATGGASLEGLTDLLECSVCLEPLGSQHRVLPCQHTFCLPCLEDLVAKHKKLQGGVAASSQGGVASNVLFLCPECRAEVTTPIQNLPTNVILNRLLSGINQQGPSPKTTPTHPPKRVPPPPLAIGDHRKLPFPSPKDNNNIPGNWTTNPFLSTPPESPIPLLPPKMAPMAKPPPVPARPQPQPHQVYRALYDYNPAKADELALKKDDLYFVIEKCQDGWYKGSSLSTLKTGVFPGNYVQHVDNEQQQQQQKKQQQSDLIDLSAFDPIISNSKKSVETSKTTMAKKEKEEENRRSLILYRVTMPFPASSPYELDLKMGDVVVMNKIREDGWCKGTLERSGQTGLFPLSFVEKIS